VKQIVKTTPDDTPYGGIVKPDGQRNGIKLIGSGGWIWVNRDEISASTTDLLRAALPANAIRLEVSDNHMRNFFDCVHSRRDPVAPVEAGHRSASIGHLIVIALRSGLKLQWNPDAEIFTGANATEANTYLAREMRPPFDYNFAS